MKSTFSAKVDAQDLIITKSSTHGEQTPDLTVQFAVDDTLTHAVAEVPSAFVTKFVYANTSVPFCVVALNTAANTFWFSTWDKKAHSVFASRDREPC